MLHGVWNKNMLPAVKQHKAPHASHRRLRIRVVVPRVGVSAPNGACLIRSEMSPKSRRIQNVGGSIGVGAGGGVHPPPNKTKKTIKKKNKKNETKQQ